MRCHHYAPAPAKLQEARNPSPDRKRTHDSASVVVQNSAIAHHEAAPGQRDDLTERRDPVLQRLCLDAFVD
jgi:hypothetical protein